MAYTIELTRAAVRDLRALDQQTLHRVDRKIRALADDPRPNGVEKLAGAELYRVRVGVWRILYEIYDARVVVVVVRVRHRREVYR